MRVGPYGILQPVADAMKLMIKEDITPVRADKWVFTLAPIISMVPALIVYAVIPFGPEVDCSAARCRSTSPTSTSACSTSCRSRRSASTASSSRLRVEQQVSAARQPARLGAADQLRGRRHADAGQRDPDVRHAQHGRHRRGAGQRAASGSRSCSRWRSSSSSSAAWRKPTARRSTCRKRSRS